MPLCLDMDDMCDVQTDLASSIPARAETRDSRRLGAENNLIKRRRVWPSIGISATARDTVLLPTPASMSPHDHLRLKKAVQLHLLYIHPVYTAKDFQIRLATSQMPFLTVQVDQEVV